LASILSSAIVARPLNNLRILTGTMALADGIDLRQLMGRQARSPRRRCKDGSHRIGAHAQHRTPHQGRPRTGILARKT
jgi:hypothetical protein